MYDHQAAAVLQIKLPLRDYHNPERLRQLLIVGCVLLILCLCDEHMGQRIGALQFEEAIKIMRLVALDAETLHQIPDQPVIVAPHLVTAVFL